MNNELYVYQLECFTKQFKMACLYRGYSTSQAIMNNLNISANSIQLIETGGVVPDIMTIIAIANSLEMDLCFFFLPDANPGHFDLQNFKDDC